MWTLMKLIRHFTLFKLQQKMLANSFEDLSEMEAMYQSRRKEILAKQVRLSFSAHSHRSQAMPIIAMLARYSESKLSPKTKSEWQSMNSTKNNATYLQQDAREAFERECA